MQALVVGQKVVAKRASAVCEVGEVGVVYERYERRWASRGERQGDGVSVLFAKGCYDGFSPDEAVVFFEAREEVCADIVDYQFQSVYQLMCDYRSGMFDAALGIESGAAPRSLRV